VTFQSNGLLTLTTDFGSRDGYVGAIKGAALSVATEVRLVDLAHDLPPQDVLHAARVVAAAAPRFPVGTVHVVVIDPGVGTARAPVAMTAGGHAFVGPDNGLFSLAVESLGGVTACHRIDAHAHAAEPPSATFHGRDLFAPTGAALAVGLLEIGDVGPPCQPTLVTAEASTESQDGRVVGCVVLVDRFGNLVTNIRSEALDGLGDAVAVTAGATTVRLSRTYGDVAVGAPVALVGSEGWLEIAVRDGSALDVLALGKGTTVIASAADQR
jgi:hypothetical protein